MIVVAQSFVLNASVAFDEASSGYRTANFGAFFNLWSWCGGY